MLKLKRIDLLKKNDKIHNKLIRERMCDHVQKYKKLECLCWEEEESLGGESWDGEEEVEIEEERVDRVGIFWLLPMESSTNTSRRYTRRSFWRWMGHVTARRSRFESLGHFIGKIVWKNSTSSHCFTFSKFYIFHWQYDRYIPMKVVHRYIPTVGRK